MDKQTPNDKLAELNRICDEQDAKHEANMTRITGDASSIDETDANRLLLLDRVRDRLPDVNLDDHEIGWHQLPDGSPALLVDGGGMDGGDGMTFANVPDSEDVHAFGPIPAFKAIGSMLIRPDGTRVLHGVMPDPVAKGRRANEGDDAV